ncbi:MAG: glycosyltransferase family 2 protein [Rikenellaceae bacterium]|nr:glycosyltransferase family 2 protein [Rikenellaceae bacterium]
MARIEIVILNWNGKEHLLSFLPSVIENTPPGIGITIADNGSEDGSSQVVESKFTGVNVIRLEKNYGFAEGYNRALSDPLFVDCEYFVLLNSDVHTPAGWLEPLIYYMDAHPATAAAAPKILSWLDREYFEYAGASGGFIDALGYPFCRGRILRTVENDSGQYDDAREVFWATGACMMVRSEVFRKLDGFDGEFFAHMEEIDFCWRARLAGYASAVVPASKVYHLGGGTLPVSNPRKLYLNYRNNLYMLYKNLPPDRRGMTITARMALDGISALIYLVTFRSGYFRAVWSAHRDFRGLKKSLDLRKGETTPRRPLKELPGVYKGSIISRYIFGKKRFDRLL